MSVRSSAYHVQLGPSVRGYQTPPFVVVYALMIAERAAATLKTTRRQFVCPDHGSFWKKVPEGGNKRNGMCVARCKKCPLVGGVGPKYEAIPVEEERGTESKMTQEV